MKKTILLLTMLALAGCTEKKPMAKISETIPNLPIPPNSDIISREGSEEALLLKFRSELPPERIAAYYREILSRDPWRLVSDNQQPDGTIALYAEQKGPPLWVTISKASGATGSVVDLAGAKTKS